MKSCRSKSLLTILIFILLIAILSLQVFTLFRPKYNMKVKALPSQYSINFTKYGTFQVPFHFLPLTIPPSTRKKPYLVGNIEGSGIIQAMAFHTDYYGVTIGFSVDNKKIHWINNGDCLLNWSANSANAANFPVTLLSYKSKNDLSIGVNALLPFKKNIKLYVTNSGNQNREINSFHVYGYFKNLRFGPNNHLQL